MTKDYQTKAAPAATDDLVPDTVSVGMGQLAETVKEGLLALAVGAAAGHGVMMQDSVTVLCGPKGRHDVDRSAVRHGQENGSVTLGAGGCRFADLGVRSAEAATEVPVPAYELLHRPSCLGEMALERMMAKLSTQRYSAGLEPVGTQVQATVRSTRSAR